MSADLMQKLMETTSGAVLPVPANYQAPKVAALLFTIWAGGFAFLVLPWVLYKLVRKNDPVPLLMWLGGWICSVLEPMLDHLGHLWWPLNLPGPAFQGFDLNIPLLIPPCYVFFIAMTGYFAYYRMQRGLTVKGLFLVWLLISMSDVIMEYPGTLSQAYIYYGNQPFQFWSFPWWWGWINGTSMFMVGFLLWLVRPRLHGWRKVFILFVPIIAMGASYGMTAWPDFMALNWKMPVLYAWLLSAFSLGLCLMVVRGIGALVATDSPVALKEWSTASYRASFGGLGREAAANASRP